MTSETKTCQNCKNQFTIEPEDFEFYKKIDVPPPTWCWLCRAERRLVFRNERYLYKRKSAWDEEIIFSMYAPETKVKIYKNEHWYSDKWDDLATGKEIDWSRPFLEQVKELISEAPLQARAVVGGSNSDYVNNATDPKNSYLIFNTTTAEDSLYSNGIDFSQECVDCSHITKCELCYGSVWLTRCSRVFYSIQCEDSSEIYFSKNLKGCTNCFGCVNLRNKSYYIFNKPYSKDEYMAELKKYGIESHASVTKLKKQASDFWKQFPSKYMQGVQNIDVSGEYIDHSKNVKYSYLVKEGENLKYCQYLQTPSVKDSYDYSLWGNGCSLMYEVCQSGHGSSNLKFCVSSWSNTHDMEYSLFCINSSYLFGCVGLRNKQYCILNKQYSKEEYEEIVPKLKKHMIENPYRDSRGIVYSYGEFFPSDFSLFAYNETPAQDQFPLTKEEALARGYRWRDSEDRQLVIDKDSISLPDTISEVADDVLSWVVGCEHNGKCNDDCTAAFRIIPQELAFYRKLNIPLPRLCFRCRIAERLSYRNRMIISKKQCMCEVVAHNHGSARCPEFFETSFSPKDSAILYCEKCYQAEVV